jgi:RNA polymerase sigma-70 factor (ECF subfamily)
VIVTGPQERERVANRRRLRLVGSEQVASDGCDGLLSATAGGDLDAFANLYDLVGGQVYGTVSKVVRDPAQSEEVTQEVMLEVWRLAGRFDPAAGRARSWILTIARRRAIDRVRSEQASRDRVLLHGAANTHRAFDEPSEQAVLTDEHAQVAAALAALTDRQREVVELAYYGGHTYREIAVLLDTPLGTIKTRMRDALIRLRRELEGAQ